MEHYADMIIEKATQSGVKFNEAEIKALPTIISGMPFFGLGELDPAILDNFGLDEDSIFQADGVFNVALHPDGRAEGLGIVSNQYKIVQPAEAIWKVYESLPDVYGLDKIDVHSSYDGGNTVAYFKSGKGIEIKDGDIIYPRTCVKNSANSTVRFQVKSAMWRLLCSNGMMGPDNRFAQISTKKLHKGSLDLDAEVAKYIDTIEDSIESASLWGQYAQKQLKAPDLDTIFQQLQVGPRVQDELLTTPLRGENKSVQTLLDSKSLTGWDFYNSFTQRITDSDSAEETKIENGIKVSNVFDKYLIAA